MAELGLEQEEIEQQVRVDLPWNFSVNLIDITFITMGLSLISRETVMPLFVSNLTDSKLVIGLIPAIYSLGFHLPQLLTASFTESLRYKKPFVMLLGGLGERVPYLLMGVIIWLLAQPSPTLTVILFLLMLATTAFTNGAATPAWYDMIAKVIPVYRRGLWSGISHGLGALLGIAGAYFMGGILESYTYPNNFALLFGLAFVATAISWVGLALNREPPSLVVKEQVPLIRYLGQLPAILRKDGNYSRFLLSRTIVQLGAMSTGFFMVYGAERFEIDGAGVGLLTAILIGSQAVMNPLLGLIGDRQGHKIVLTLAAFGIALATLVSWMAASQSWMLLTFALLGIYLAADSASSMNIILEFCEPEDRPTYIGLTNTLLAPVLTLAPILGGLLADWLDYQGMFIIALLIATFGGILMTFWVREPREMVRNQSTVSSRQ